jgi:beta-aspartyl-dipeptidase (metallo-type)
MLTIIREGNVFAPEPLGRKDVLIEGSRIGAIGEPGEIQVKGLDVQVVEAGSRIVIPGLVDTHVHILGGGGEGGPATRAPEIAIEDIVQSGVTTLIACLGTDGVTRHMESLLAKARGLEVEGITTFIFSGSYEIPVKTLTGSVRSDLVLIDKVVGAGEIAISDHRSSQPTFDEFARLASECRVGGMLGGKAGVLHCHLGDGSRRLELLFQLIRQTEIPATQVMPTHVNRNRPLLEEAMEWVKTGGFADLTTGPDPEPESGEAGIEESFELFIKNKIPLTNITVSSDSNGSFPVFDEKGQLVCLTIARQKDLLRKFRDLVVKKILTVEEAARVFSTNPAAFYKFARKGEIKVGKDADLLVFDRNYHLTHVFALGRIMMTDGKLLARGTFSPR